MAFGGEIAEQQAQAEQLVARMERSAIRDWWTRGLYGPGLPCASPGLRPLKQITDQIFSKSKYQASGHAGYDQKV